MSMKNYIPDSDISGSSNEKLQHITSTKKGIDEKMRGFQVKKSHTL